MDISAHNKTALEIFKTILEKGPITLYKTNSESNLPIGTIHRHFKEMLSLEIIKPYDVSSEGRRKIEYGPTLYGLIYFYRLDNAIKKNIGKYYEKWVEKNQFVSDLKEAGFDEKTLRTKSSESKKIFEKFVHFYSGVEEELDFFTRNINEISREVRWFLGAFLLVRKKEYMQEYEEIVRSLPGYRSDVSGFLEEIVRSYSKLKKMKNDTR